MQTKQTKEKAQRAAYCATEMTKKASTIYEWATAIGIIVIAITLYRMVQSTGMIDAISPNSENITFGVALLIGVVASLSSCMATVGGVILAFAQRYAKTDTQTLRKTIQPHIVFHFGRIGSFFVLGGILGAIGGTVHISGTAIGIFNVVIAVIMAWLGLNILGLAPSIARFGIRTPKRVTTLWNRTSESKHPATPFILGGLSFFLPCGFTQSMQLFAIASGNAWIGGTSLAIFAIGTMPALMALGVASGWSSAHEGRVFKKVAGLVILLFAVTTFSAGHALWGTKSAVLYTGTQEQGAVAPTPTGNEQVIRTRITATGFDPETIELKKGVPVKWIISTEQTGGCTNRIIIPSLNISKDIVVGDNVVYFTPTEDGAIPFSCWMGMVRGSFIVE